MGIFDKLFGKKEVWRDSAGNIRCPGDACPKEKCDDSCPVWQNTIAGQLMQMNENAKALKIYEELVKKYPDFYDAWNNLGAVYGGFGTYEGAYNCYKKAHELNKQKYQPLYGLALCCRDLNKYDECLYWCNEYDKLNPDRRTEPIRRAVKKAREYESMDTPDELYLNGKKYSCIMKCSIYNNIYSFVTALGGPVLTPGGNKLQTENKLLAERIFADLERYGTLYMGVDSILPWQYTFQDNFKMKKNAEIVDILLQSFIRRPDWTYIGKKPEWTKYFGAEATRKPEIVNWLSQLNTEQLTAACCIGNAYHSLNVAYAMAKVAERYRETKLRSAITDFADTFHAATEALGKESVAEIVYDIDTFILYFNSNPWKRVTHLNDQFVI